jgi:hypothetical protein
MQISTAFNSLSGIKVDLVARKKSQEEVETRISARARETRSEIEIGRSF